MTNVALSFISGEAKVRFGKIHRCSSGKIFAQHQICGTLFCIGSCITQGTNKNIAQAITVHITSMSRSGPDAILVIFTHQLVVSIR